MLSRSESYAKGRDDPRAGEEARRLAAIVEASEDAIVSATLDGIFTSWNASAERLFGYTADEAIGAPITLVLPEDRLDERRRFIERLRQGKRVPHFESVRLTKSGQRVQVSVGIAGIRDARGQLVGVAASARDISQRLQAEALIEESAERFRALSETTREGIAIHDGERILETNAAFCALFDYSGEEILGHDPMAFVALEARDEAFSKARSGSAEPYESVGLRRDGTRFPIEICGRSIVYRGRPVRVKLVRDLSAQKQAELTLRREQELLRRILDTIPVMIAVYRPDTKVLQLNPAFEQLTGWTTEEARDIDLMAACYPDPAHREEVRAYMTSLEPGWRDLPMTTRDGRVLQTSWANTLLSDDTYVGIGIDVSERRNAEERQQLLLNELSHRVKNILASVQSIARQSLSGERTLAEAGEAFAKRLRALAQTHDLLTVSAWHGASLTRLVEGELRPWGKRVAVRGEDVVLRPRPAQTFGLVLHELATNAAKYGALSASKGRVEVVWSITEQQCLRLIWRERGGPEVAPPARLGFGRRMIEGAAAHDLQGAATLSFSPEGVVCELIAPLRELAVS